LRSENEFLRSQASEAKVSFQEQLETSQRNLVTIEQEKVGDSQPLPCQSEVCADSCFLRELQDSFDRLAKSDRQKEERVQDLTKRLEEMV
jgi:hypothetical protein